MGAFGTDAPDASSPLGVTLLMQHACNPLRVRERETKKWLLDDSAGAPGFLLYGGVCVSSDKVTKAGERKKGVHILSWANLPSPPRTSSATHRKAGKPKEAKQQHRGSEVVERGGGARSCILA